MKTVSKKCKHGEEVVFNPSGRKAIVIKSILLLGEKGRLNCGLPVLYDASSFEGAIDRWIGQRKRLLKDKGACWACGKDA